MKLRAEPRRLALPPLLAACDGRGAAIAGEAASNFGEAMQVVGLILLGLAVLAALVYLAVWWWLVRSWRRGRASRAAAVLLLAAHVVALLLSGEAPEVHRWFWWTAPLPAAAFALACASRLPVRALVGVAATAGMCLLPVDPGPLSALPGPVVDVTSAFDHGCVVTDGGVPVCVGSVTETCAHPPRAHFWGPQPLAGVTDAARVIDAMSRRCVVHRDGAVTCCGGDSQAPGMWRLPVDRPVTDLVVTGDQLLARTGDDLHGWPHPLPDGLTSARAIAGNESTQVRFAVVDRGGTLWMWRQDRASVIDLVRFDGLADAEEVAVQHRTGACVRRTSGAVVCHPWPRDDRPPHEVPGLRAAQLVALDDAFDSFCARTPEGAVLCWEEDDPPTPYAPLPRATRLVSTSSTLCDIADRARCVPVSGELDDPLRQLLPLQVGPPR